MSETFFAAMDLETEDTLHRQDMLTCSFHIIDEDFKIIEELSLQLKPKDRLPIVEVKALETNESYDIRKHIEDPNTITYAEAKKIMSLLRDI